MDSGNESPVAGPGGSSPHTPPPEGDADSEGIRTSKPSIVEAKQDFDNEDDEEWRRQFYKTKSDNVPLVSEGARASNATSGDANMRESAAFDPNEKVLPAMPKSSGDSDDSTSAALGPAVRSADSPRDAVLNAEKFPSLDEEIDQRRDLPAVSSKAFVQQQLSDVTSDPEGETVRSTDGSHQKQLEDDAAAISERNPEESPTESTEGQATLFEDQAATVATAPTVASAKVGSDVGAEADAADRSNEGNAAMIVHGTADKTNLNLSAERGTMLKFDLPAQETVTPMTPRGGGRSPDSPSFEDERDDDEEEHIAALSLDSDEHSHDVLDAATAAAEQAAADAERAVAAAESSVTTELSPDGVNSTPASVAVVQNDIPRHTQQSPSDASADVAQNLIVTPANSDAAAVNTEISDNSVRIREPLPDVAGNATLQVLGADDIRGQSDTVNAVGDAGSDGDLPTEQGQKAHAQPEELPLAGLSPSEVMPLTFEANCLISTPPPQRKEDDDVDLETTPQTQHTMVTASPNDTSSIMESDLDSTRQDSPANGDSIVQSIAPPTTKSSEVLSPGGDEAQEMIREVLGSVDSFASSREIHANGVPGNTPKSGAVGGSSNTGRGGFGGSGLGDDENKIQDDEEKSADAPTPPLDPEALAQAAKAARKAREDAFVESCAAFAKSVLCAQQLLVKKPTHRGSTCTPTCQLIWLSDFAGTKLTVILEQPKGNANFLWTTPSCNSTTILLLPVLDCRWPLVTAKLVALKLWIVPAGKALNQLLLFDLYSTRTVCLHYSMLIVTGFLT